MKITILKIESTVDIHAQKSAVSKKMSIKSPHEGKRAAEKVEDLKSL